MADPNGAHKAASGVEALIARLKEEGVAAGRAQAERLLDDAQAKARAMVERAEAEATQQIETARKQAESFRRAGEEALRVAARDAVLDLKDQLTRQFAKDVAKTVAAATRDDELLQRMILAVVDRARTEGEVDAAEQVRVLLPREVVGLDDLRRKPEELREGSLTHFVAVVAADMLREGVTFGRGEDVVK
jgi:V/A-type H+-transporting ATPase subunit E